MSLANKSCIPCRGGVPPMERSRADELLRELDDSWRLNADGHLERAYLFKDFAKAMAFANRGGRYRGNGEPSSRPSHRMGQVQGGDLDAQDPRVDRERFLLRCQSRSLLRGPELTPPLARLPPVRGLEDGVPQPAFADGLLVRLYAGARRRGNATLDKPGDQTSQALLVTILTACLSESFQVTERHLRLMSSKNCFGCQDLQARDLLPH